MKRWIALALFASLSACNRAPSSFAFDLAGDVNERVQSSANARGSVDNAGFLTLDDEAWGLRFSLGGLGPGSRTVSKGQGTLVIMSKVKGDVFTSDLGSCSVWVDPHDSTNGSEVTGWFTCTALGSVSGQTVRVESGRFTTFISDSANNPANGAPPGGPV